MLELTNVVNISVSQAPTALGNYKVNNLALFSADPFLVNTDNDVFRTYVSPAAVATDFGSTSETYLQANAVFAQQPNILAGGGELIVFPFSDASEAVSTAVTRVKDLAFFTGIISTRWEANSLWPALATAVQALGDKMLFLPSATYSDVAGAFTTIKAAGNSRTRCLFCSTTIADARLFAAAAAGRGMCVNFEGSNTAITMNLKQLVGINPDEGISQTYYNALATAGVDSYVSYAGVPAYVSNGANGYFDDVFNLIWLVGQLRVNGFNALAGVGNKIPQTEPGMNVLKGAYRNAVEQALRNGYLAPGSWTSAETFGVQEDMLHNIEERGYYIYSVPVNLQSAASRAARQAPLVQIAIKLAGAIHSTNVLVSINA